MSSVASEILADLVQALRGTGKFRHVTLGEAGSAAEVPRASVLHEGQDSFQPDDAVGVQWYRLRATVSVHTRSTDASEAVTRANELYEEATQALLQDPFRSGHCQDLPIGRATEIGRSQLVRDLKRPEVEMAFDVRCHFQN